MGCWRVRRWISRRLDGELDGRDEAALAGHLAGCGACRAYADELSALELDLLDVPEPTAGFAARVLARLDESPVQRRAAPGGPGAFWPLAAGLGVAAALAGFAVGSLLRQTERAAAAPRSDTVALAAAGEAIDPLAADSVESVLLATLSNAEE